MNGLCFLIIKLQNIYPEKSKQKTQHLWKMKYIWESNQTYFTEP